MRHSARFFLIPALAVLAIPALGASYTDSEELQPLFEISIFDEEEPLPQTPDTLSVDLTNDLLGTGLAKVVVKKGAKTVKKLYKKAKENRAARIAARNFPPKGGLGTLRVVTYNVGTFHKSGFDKTYMVADMMNEMKADVAGIQELDSCATRTGGVYQLRTFADALGDWNYRFAPAIPFDGGTYGIGIVSKKKYRVLDSWSMTLDRGKGAEQRALDVVEFRKFVLATTHLDHKSDAAQLAQAKAINQALYDRYAGTHKVVILCGDFNAKPNSKTIKELKKNWTIVSAQNNTYDSSRPKSCIDYIMILDNNASYVLRHTAVASKFDDGDVTQASDHLPVYIDIKPKRR